MLACVLPGFELWLEFLGWLGFQAGSDEALATQKGGFQPPHVLHCFFLFLMES